MYFSFNCPIDLHPVLNIPHPVPLYDLDLIWLADWSVASVCSLSYSSQFNSNFRLTSHTGIRIRPRKKWLNFGTHPLPDSESGLKTKRICTSLSAWLRSCFEDITSCFTTWLLSFDPDVTLTLTRLATSKAATDCELRHLSTIRLTSREKWSDIHENFMIIRILRHEGPH